MSKLIPENIPDPRKYTGFLLWQKSNAWEKHVNQKLKTFNITQSEIFQLISLSLLLSEQQEVTQVELANFTGITAMNVSKIIKTLEQKGLIQRTTGTDSRSKALEVTENGIAILIQSAEILVEANNTFFPQKDAEKFYKYLSSLNSFSSPN